MNDAKYNKLKNEHKIRTVTPEYIIMESGVTYSTHNHYIAGNCIMNTNGCLVVQLNKHIDKNSDSAINGCR